MSETTDPRWPKMLSLAVHEFRTPMTVVLGYVRMLQQERAGPLTEQQRRLLEEVEKSCGRLTALVAETSDLAQLEAGTAVFNRSSTDLRDPLRHAADDLAPLPDRELRIDLRLPDAPALVHADPGRLKHALQSILGSLRRELVTSDTLVVRLRPATMGARPHQEILIGDDPTITALETAGSDALPQFDELRGGSGLGLPIAKLILTAFDGRIWGAPDNAKAGARLLLPAA
jgi:two-component system OmpR family sensor kinase